MKKENVSRAFSSSFFSRVLKIFASWQLHDANIMLLILQASPLHEEEFLSEQSCLLEKNFMRQKMDFRGRYIRVFFLLFVCVFLSISNSELFLVPYGVGEDSCCELCARARYKSIIQRSLILILNSLILNSLARVTPRARIANLLVEDSCCRGGIVHIRGGRSRALLVRPKSPKALWRFRASTSNSLSGRSRPQTNTQLRYIYHTYARQDIRVCGDDHF